MANLSPIPPLSWPSNVRLKCESYRALLQQAQPLSQALAIAKQKHDTIALQQGADKLDALQVEIFRSLRRKTMQEAFEEKGASIAELTKVSAPGRPEVSLATTMLTVVVAQQVQYFNVGKTLNAAQVAIVVEELIERFDYMTLEEIATAFALHRRTAQVYDRLDPNILIGWIYDYDLTRDQLCETMAYKQKQEREPDKHTTGEEMTYDEYLIWLDKEIAKGKPEAIKAKINHNAVMHRMEEPARQEAAFQNWKKSTGL